MGGLNAQVGLLLAALTLNPQENVARDDVDLMEVNHYYDECGKHVFDQLIFYDWSAAESRHQVRAWRLIKKPTQVPHRDHRLGGFVTSWHDGDLLRSVRAAALRETWTQYDPELVERAALPKNKRRELRRFYSAKGE